MNIFLHLIYDFFKMLVWGTLRVYYRHILLLNRTQLDSKSPLLIIANHPNTISDPLLVVVHLREKVFFLANYGLFKNPIASWLLNRLYCIPVKRPQDVDGTPQNNDDAFRRCDEHLQKGGNLFVAPEGVSFMERRIQPLKFGAVRIGFSAEIKNNFDMNLRVLPVGVSYDAPNQFRSRVVVNAGELMDLRDWGTAYHENPKKAMEDLRGAMEKRLQDLTIHCADAAEGVFLQKLEQVADSETKANTQNWFERGQKWTQILKHLKTNEPQTYIHLQHQTETYFAQYPVAVPADSLRLLKLIIGLPVFIYGFLNHMIALAVPYFLNKKMNMYVGYHSTVKYLSGWFSFGLSYYYQIKCFNAYFNDIQWTILYGLTLMPIGWLAWEYYRTATLWYQDRQFQQLPKTVQKSWHDLKTQIQTIFEPA